MARGGAGLMIENARNQDTLILPLIAHIDPRTLRDCKNVRRVVISSFVAVLLDNSISVEREVLVRVHGD